MELRLFWFIYKLESKPFYVVKDENVEDEYKWRSNEKQCCIKVDFNTLKLRQWYTREKSIFQIWYIKDTLIYQCFPNSNLMNCENANY